MRVKKVDKKVCLNNCNGDVFIQQNTSPCQIELTVKMNNGATP